MAEVFYWHSWLVVIIILFFLPSSRTRFWLVSSVLVIMILYQYSFSAYNITISSNVMVMLFIGLTLWLKPGRIFVRFFSPVLIAIGFTCVKLFTMMHPVWYVLISDYIIIISLYVLIGVYQFTLYEQLGLWVLGMALAHLMLSATMSLVAFPLADSSQEMMIACMKGMLILLIIHSVRHLKAWLMKVGSNKGAVPL
ncbi:hypothetical protein [Thalassobacillus sp. CUG 92003]|uniref:YphA family membrane protein n=1 Tax=Thalassobacillus sp. CUG 92003 TaxID=2736641 RepID=UPI0015E6B6FB|nr:hypothetical protein [Thalassobacillus sp. CUG 92003]